MTTRRFTLVKTMAVSLGLSLSLSACASEHPAPLGQTDQQENGRSDQVSEIETAMGLFTFEPGFHQPIWGPAQEIRVELPADLKDRADYYNTEGATREYPPQVTELTHPQTGEVTPVEEWEDKTGNGGVYEAIIIRSANDHPDAEDRCAIEVEYEFTPGAEEELVQHLDDMYATSRTHSSIGQDTQDNPVTREIIHTSCAANSAEESETFKFPTTYWSAGDSPVDQTPGFGMNTFAEFSVSVMANGDLYIPEHEVSRWQRDTNGDWIRG